MEIFSKVWHAHISQQEAILYDKFRIEEGYFVYGNFEFENGNFEFENCNFEKQSGELKTRWGTKSKVGIKS